MTGGLLTRWMSIKPPAGAWWVAVGVALCSLGFSLAAVGMALVDMLGRR